MKRIKSTRERYFRELKKKYKDGIFTICFNSWPDKPTFELWANWPHCDTEKCVVKHRCEFGGRDPYCRMIRNRISKLLQHIEDSFKYDPLSEEKLARIGCELMPLYAQLIRAQMYDEERTAMVENPDDFNSPKFTWAYREVQSLIKLVNQQWREIGVYSKTAKAIQRVVELPNKASEEPKEEKLPYYENMAKKHLEKIKAEKNDS